MCILERDKAKIAVATQKSSKYKGEQKNNIYTPGILKSGQPYYWRIDSVINGTVLKGEVFEFTVK